jgi:hypothetical protein
MVLASYFDSGDFRYDLSRLSRVGYQQLRWRDLRDLPQGQDAAIGARLMFPPHLLDA